MEWQTTEPPENEEIEYRRDNGTQVFVGMVRKGPVWEGEVQSPTPLYVTDDYKGPLFAVTSWRRPDPAIAL